MEEGLTFAGLRAAPDYFSDFYCSFGSHAFSHMVTAGMYPAQRAAEMTPVESLR
jgi:ABC-type lipoprotein release transport system permease subunit